MDIDIERVFLRYLCECRAPLLKIRQLIFDTANKMPEAGAIEESLKWGQPSYSTVSPKTGTPIRLDRFGEDKISVFFHCQTTLITNFRTLFSNELDFSGNRAIILDPAKELPINELTICIEMALTYLICIAAKLDSFCLFSAKQG